MGQNCIAGTPSEIVVGVPQFRKFGAQFAILLPESSNVADQTLKAAERSAHSAVSDGVCAAPIAVSRVNFSAS